MNKKILVILAAVLVIIVSFGLYKNNSSKKPSQTLPENPPLIKTAEEEKKVIPTLSKERKEIISKIETLVVEINDTSVVPQTLTVKPFDQVSFVNKSSSVIKVIGEGWGNIPIATGENYTRAFDTVGTFTYQINGLSSSLSGEIIVE